MENIENLRQIRKIQFSGGSTYVISLPKIWVEELGIKPGESITIVKNSNKSMTLYPREKKGLESKKVAVIQSSKKDPGESIKRKIIAAYLAGYKTIKLRSKGMKIPLEQIQEVRKLVRSSMIGTEIVESSSDGITIQILTRLPELSFDVALKRMFLMASNMVMESIDSLSERDVLHAEEVENMDDEVDRFSLYIRRNLALALGNEAILQEIGLRQPSDCLGFRTVVNRIERIGDHASLIAKRVKFLEENIDPKIISKIKKLSEKSLNVFEESITAIQTNDFEKGETVAQKVRDVIDEEKNIMSSIKENSKNSGVIRFTLEDLRRIAENSGDIAEVVIDENIHKIISEE